MRRVVLYLAALSSFGLRVDSGRTSGPSLTLGTAQARKPTLPATALPVPLMLQETDFSCGPAALRAVLHYLGAWHGAENKLYKILDASPENGTLPENLVVGARSFGLQASIEQQMSIERLRTLFSLQKIVILELQAWRDADRQTVAWRDNWDDGHFVVLIGIDDDFAYFMDPSTETSYTYLPLTELMERWHDVNQVRKDPRVWRDVQLGVIISGLPHGPRPHFITHRLLRLE
jgi:predicted double-glycine peptidase